MYIKCILYRFNESIRFGANAGQVHNVPVQRIFNGGDETGLPSSHWSQQQSPHPGQLRNGRFIRDQILPQFISVSEAFTEKVTLFLSTHATKYVM